MDKNQVIEELKKYLLASGYTLISECSTIMQGIDLVMKRGNQELWIEAKGETSSRQGSSRFQMPFTDTQCHVHYSRAFFKACEMRDKAKLTKQNVRIAIAFAHTKHYQKYFDRTNETRKELGIGLYWVKGVGVIEEA